MNLKPMIVTWVDSRRDLHETVFSDEEMDSFPLAEIRSIGYGRILKDKIVLAIEYYPLIKDLQSEQVRGIYSIPRDCIKNIVELKEVGKKSNFT